MRRRRSGTNDDKKKDVTLHCKSYSDPTRAGVSFHDVSYVCTCFRAVLLPLIGLVSVPEHSSGYGHGESGSPAAAQRGPEGKRHGEAKQTRVINSRLEALKQQGALRASPLQRAHHLPPPPPPLLTWFLF